MMSRDLEAAIIADPEDPAAYLVYADALQVAGDPRGDLIAVQAALASHSTSVALRDAEADLIDAHFSLFDSVSEGMRCFVKWFCGFWRALWVSCPDDDNGVRVAQLLTSPSARFLRRLEWHRARSPRVLELVAPMAATLRELRILLDHVEFSDDQLAALASFKRLRSLELTPCRDLTAEGLAVLKKLPELTRLHLNNCPMSDATLRALSGIPLTDLRLSSMADDLTAEGIRVLAAAPLRRLRLVRREVGALEDLYATYDELLSPLTAHPTLTSLNMTNGQLTIEGGRTLASMPGLRRLNLRRAEIDGSVLAPLRRLTSLCLSQCEAVSDATCDTLAAFDRLSALDVSGTAITSVGLRALARIRSLTMLDLSFLALRDGDLAPLQELANLRYLALTGNALTDRVIDTLAQLPQLEALFIHENDRMTEAALAQLAQRYPEDYPSTDDDFDDVSAYIESGAA